MNRAKGALVVLAVVMVGGLTACGKSPTRNGVQIDTAATMPACASNRADCFAEAQMGTYLSRSIGAAMGGFYRAWDTDKFKLTVILIPRGKSSPDGCRGADVTSTEISYCPSTITIAVGLDKLMAVYGDGTRDLGPMLIFARMIADMYHKQGLRAGNALDYGDSVLKWHANTPWCLSGAFATYAIEARQKPAQVQADAAAVRSNRKTLTAVQQQAFDDGRAGGPKKCGY